ncbi:MAG: hypothetical protein ACK5Z2_00460 [Bacteroidota bacterium]|jgi:hypothetical protein
MNSYSSKLTAAQTTSRASADTQQKNNTITPSFSDNRPETATQNALHTLVQHSSQSIQMKNYQAITNQHSAPIQFGKRSHSQAFGKDKEIEDRPKKRRRLNLPGEDRLRRTNLRNRKQKATPQNDRDVFEYQELHSYGYDNKLIEYGDVKGDFYKGPFVNQPYLRIDKDDYKLKVKPKTNYDDIISGLEKYEDDAKLAQIILDKIYEGVELPKKLNSTIKANAALLIQLTQFIENHDTRIPGVDKLARSFLKKISEGELTFREVFNRKNGLFVVARAKGGGSKYGGQEAGRTLFGLEPKKSDKSKLFEIWSSEIEEVANDMSDSSDEESND